MSKKLRGLFLNTEKAICSVYESGRMCYDCLIRSEIYSLDYIELSAEKREICLDYDFYIFNYHVVKMGWLDTKFIKQLPGFKATIVLEMSENNPFESVSKDDFDAYLVLDPTCKHFVNNVYAFPRPLEVGLNPITPYKAGEVPVIGTFGLSIPDKGFDEVVRAVNKEFEAAYVRINVPNSEHNTSQNVSDFKSLLAGLNLKDSIKVELSNHYFNKKELINWCAQNTLNIFLYNRRIGVGLSTTTDQAIASGRPLAISTDPTFRHIHKYIKPYPYLSLKESIETTIPLVKKIQDDWCPPNFVLQFEAVLRDNNIKSVSITNAPKIKLPLINNSSSFVSKVLKKHKLEDFIPPILFEARLTRLKFRTIFNRNNTIAQEVPELHPFVHHVLLSYSQFHEDLLIDLLMNRKKDGVYVDIGTNDPFINNNTQRFYLRGWRGINIEPGLAAYKKIANNRVFDINLNIAVSEESGKLTFYQIGNDSSLSTLDYGTAVRMAEACKLELTSFTVAAMPVSKILDTYLANRHIDFMSVDASGCDLAVLKSNDWDKYRPSLVMVNSNIDSRKIIVIMDSYNYLYIFSNHTNAIFVDKMTPDQNLLNNISWNS
jgi:FkbM family methyltransferase